MNSVILNFKVEKVLSPENFYSILNNKIALVKFYS